MRPPELLRAHFKKWQKASTYEIDESTDILDFSCLERVTPHASEITMTLDQEELEASERCFLDHNAQDTISRAPARKEDFSRQFEVKALPGATPSRQ
jgi:hypothetical protein